MKNELVENRYEPIARPQLITHDDKETGYPVGPVAIAVGSFVALRFRQKDDSINCMVLSFRWTGKKFLYDLELLTIEKQDVENEDDVIKDVPDRFVTFIS